jgi:uncharacterized RmlC-like cupin family protein
MAIDWRTHGVYVVGSGELDTNTSQTPGMTRAAAITTARAGAEKLWAGTVDIEPDAKTGAHHHGPVESVIYVVFGRARMRWGERLEYVAEAGPGDFIYVPPYVPHQEINAEVSEPLSCVVVRSGQEAVVVNLDLPEVERDAISRPQADWHCSFARLGAAQRTSHGTTPRCSLGGKGTSDARGSESAPNRLVRAAHAPGGVA